MVLKSPRAAVEVHWLTCREWDIQLASNPKGLEWLLVLVQDGATGMQVIECIEQITYIPQHLNYGAVVPILILKLEVAFGC